MGRLTTHVLDLERGAPAAGLAVSLFDVGGASPRLIAEAATNGDGRLEAPLLEGETMIEGFYELRFAAGAYHRASGAALPAGVFLDEVPIRFRIADPESHYHVPLLLSPYGYSTYRGS